MREMSEMSTRTRLCILNLLLFSAAVLSGQALHASFMKKQPLLPHGTQQSAAKSLPARLVQAALSYLGVPYLHAGDSRSGMDCSGLVHRVFLDTTGVNLPRGVETLYRAAESTRFPLHIGDLLVFDTTEHMPPSAPTHVGVSIGQGRVVHAASEGSKTGVIVSVMDDPYYHDRFIGARRVLSWRVPVLDLTLTDVTSTLAEAEPFASREEVTLRVFNGMSGGGPVSLSLVKDGRQVLSRWIVPGAQKPAEISFEAGVGQWSVLITRIFKGRTLSNLAFSVVE
jgi:hypothetical protein